MKTKAYLKKILFTVAIALAFAGCSSQSHLDIVGEWKINADKSAIEVAKGKQMNDEAMEKVKESITKRIQRFTIIVDAKNVNIQGKQLPYTIVSELPDEVIVEADADGQKVTLTFAAYDNESITIKSSATNDMDYYVWDKTGSKKSPGKVTKNSTPKDSKGRTADEAYVELCHLLIDKNFDEARKYFSDEYVEEFATKYKKTFESTCTIIPKWKKEWLKPKVEGNKITDEMWRVKMIPDEGKGSGNGSGRTHDFVIIDGEWKVVFWGHYKKS